MKSLIFLLPCLVPGPSLVQGQSTCCPTKVVRGMTGLDDTYTLSDGKTPPSEDEEVCADGCVYTRNNPEDQDDEYCFKNEQAAGSVQCKDPSVGDLQSQKSALENEVADLEKEVKELEANETIAIALETELNKADAKIDELTADTTTPAGRVRRQELTTQIQGPTTCDQIADIIEQLAIATSDAERLNLVIQILSTKITKCRSKDKLTKTKIKIKTVKTETGVRIKIILKEKSTKKAQIKEKKKLIIKITVQIEVIQGNTSLPPKPTADMPVSKKPTGEVGVPMNSTGEQAVSMKPTGEVEVPMNSTGEQAVSMKPTGEQAVSIILGGSTNPPTGEVAVSIILDGSSNAPTGEVSVPMNLTGQQAVEIKPTGQQAVEIKPIGQQAVEMTMDGSTGQQAVGITGGVGQSTMAKI